MATLTLGTNATTSLTALLMGNGVGAGGKMNAADLATLDQLIKDDQGNAHAIWPGAIENGMLYVPNRGQLLILPGDYIGVDSTTGWPILLSARAIASGPWSHS